MNLSCCDTDKVWLYLITAILYMILEAWIGKTTRTKATSTLELALMVVIAVTSLVVRLFKGKNKMVETPVGSTSETPVPSTTASEAPAPLGTKELKEVLALVVDAVNVGVEAEKNDGKINVGDLPLLMKLLPDLVPAVSGLSSVPAEIADLTEAEVEDLVAFVISKLAVDSEKAVKVLTASFKILTGVVAMIEALKS